jgi:hypothetical protein
LFPFNAFLLELCIWLVFARYRLFAVGGKHCNKGIKSDNFNAILHGTGNCPWARIEPCTPDSLYGRFWEIHLKWMQFCMSGMSSHGDPCTAIIFWSIVHSASSPVISVTTAGREHTIYWGCYRVPRLLYARGSQTFVVCAPHPKMFHELYAPLHPIKIK